MSEIALYDAACQALARAVTADEFKAVRYSAIGFQAIARAAKNFDLQINAVKLQVNAELKLGDLLLEAEKQGHLREGRPEKKKNGTETEPISRFTLKEIGVDRRLSADAQKLSGIGQRAVDAMLRRFEDESRKRRRLARDVINAEIGKRNADSRRDLARELSNCTALQPIGRKFPVLYADPAVRRKAGTTDRSYENHYPTMTWDELVAMPVAQRMLPDSWGFIWLPRAHVLALHPMEIETPLGRTTVKMPLAWALAMKWGFEDYSTCFVWTKTDEEHEEAHGTGLIAWDQDEILCMFKRGRGLPKPDSKFKPGSNHRERSRGHSAKPEYYRDMINGMTGNLPVLELFAREDEEHILPDNFFTWGNESKNTAELPPHDPATGEIATSEAAE